MSRRKGQHRPRSRSSLLPVVAIVIASLYALFAAMGSGVLGMAAHERTPSCRCGKAPSVTDQEDAIVSNVSSEVTVEMLDAFAGAWNRHDAEALMSFMSDDCVFESSAGPDLWGTRYVGRDAVRAGFVEVWTNFPDAHWGNARHFVHGDRGVSEWTFTGTRTDGTRVEVHGCDLFRFRDGKITLKNSYRKNRPPVTHGTTRR